MIRRIKAQGSKQVSCAVPTLHVVKKQATCCPPLANFAQLSMFRFDGLKITLVMSDGNNLIYNYHHKSYNGMITKRIYFCKKEGLMDFWQ